MKRNGRVWAALGSLAIALMACSPQAPQATQGGVTPSAALPAAVVDEAKVVAGQTLYVPIYSEIYHGNSRRDVIQLAATLSIRNTDPTHSIMLTSVRYYDSEGMLVRQDISSPVELKPLASTAFFVAADDLSGGSGANFIVEWVAEHDVFNPVIEAVMIGTSSSQGISFVSPAKVLHQRGKPEP